MHREKRNNPKHDPIHCSPSHQAPAFAVLCRFNPLQLIFCHQTVLKLQKNSPVPLLPPLQPQTMTESGNLQLSFSPAKPSHCRSHFQLKIQFTATINQGRPNQTRFGQGHHQPRASKKNLGMASLCFFFKMAANRSRIFKRENSKLTANAVQK